MRRSRAKRGDANYCISTAVRCKHGACIKRKKRKYQRKKRKSRCGGKPPHPRVFSECLCAYARLSMPWLTRYCALSLVPYGVSHTGCFAIRSISVLHRPWRSMRPIHGTSDRSAPFNVSSRSPSAPDFSFWMQAPYLRTISRLLLL